MRRLPILLILLCTGLPACVFAQQLVFPTTQAQIPLSTLPAGQPLAPMTPQPAPASPVATSDMPVQASPGAPEQTPTLSTHPSPTPANGTLDDSLKSVIASSFWPDLRLPADLAQKWESYAAGQLELSASDVQLLQDFLSQWERMQLLAGNISLPDQSRLGFRVKEAAGPQEPRKLLLYAVDEQASEQTGVEQLFLIVHNPAGEAVGLTLAPLLENLRQQISLDGEFVDYIDQDGKILLSADARPMGDGDPQGKQLKEVLSEVYGRNFYTLASVYPRFHIRQPGTDVIFYALEKNVSYSQVVLLKETLDLFNRPAFESLKPWLFGDKVAYIPLDKISGDVAGLTYTGTGVITLDRRDLFGNKYHLAAVIAHEGSHVLQGDVGQDATCDDVLRREVGDHTIPDELYTWTGDELMQAIEDGKIGSYHVSLWMLAKLGIDDLAFLQGVIRTGTANGQSVVFCQ